MANGNSSFIENLDKISYGIAGVLALVLLLIPVFSGGEVKRLLGEVTDNRLALEQKEAVVEVPPVPRPVETLQKQWRLDAVSALPAWSSHVRPAFIQWVQQPDVEPVSHAAPTISRIEYRRSAEHLQTFLRVIGSFGAINLPDKGQYVDVKLLRREGDEGDFVELRGFDAAAALEAGKIEYDDGFDSLQPIEAGKTYTYRLETTIGLRPGAENAKLDESAPNPQGVELTTASPVPYDVALNVVVARPFDVTNGKDAEFFGGIVHADFSDETAVVKLGDNQTYREGFEFGPEWGERNRKLWILRPIEEGRVTVFNTKKRARVVLTSADRDRQVELPPPTEPSEQPAEPEGAAEPAVGGSGGTAEPAVSAPEEEKPTPPAGSDSTKKKKKSRGRFR